MEKVKLTKGTLFNQDFWNSFNHMMKCKCFSATTKLELVKAKKTMIEEHNDIREAMQGVDSANSAKDILDKEIELDMDAIKSSIVINDLTAEQMYQLEPFIHIGE